MNLFHTWEGCLGIIEALVQSDRYTLLWCSSGRGYGKTNSYSFADYDFYD
ncbi:MAG: hypothetical protein RMY29_004360 [Nostoc sp. CreGUA01]